MLEFPLLVEFGWIHTWVSPHSGFFGVMPYLSFTTSGWVLKDIVRPNGRISRQLAGRTEWKESPGEFLSSPGPSAVMWRCVTHNNWTLDVDSRQSTTKFLSHKKRENHWVLGINLVEERTDEVTIRSAVTNLGDTTLGCHQVHGDSIREFPRAVRPGTQLTRKTFIVALGFPYVSYPS